jgi:hypothetical protein
MKNAATMALACVAIALCAIPIALCALALTVRDLWPIMRRAR